MKKSIKVLAVTGAAIMGLGGTALGLLGTQQVLAQALEDGEQPAIVTNIAEKFGLNVDEVAQVFSDTRSQMETERLDKAVADGVITEDQKSLIEEKQAELEGKMEEIRNELLTADERHTRMQSLMDETRQWADENGIPMYLLRGGMGAGRDGRMGGFGSGMRGDCQFAE